MKTVSKKLTTYETIDAARQFANRLLSLQYVEEVVLEEVGQEVFRLWVVLSSPAFEDQYADPVYEAQEQLIGELSEPVFDFRVINVNEIKGRLEETLPQDADVLYVRPVRA